MNEKAADAPRDVANGQGEVSELTALDQRVNAQILPDAARALAELVAVTGMKKVELVNRALQVYGVIDAAQRAGTAVVFRGVDGSEERVRFL